MTNQKILSGGTSTSSNRIHYNQLTSFPFKRDNFLLLETVYPNDGHPTFVITVPVKDDYRNTVFHYDDSLSPVHRNALHKHEFYELIYVIRGTMYQKIENIRHLYPAGSLCLLNKNIHHSEEFHTYYQTAFLALPEELLDAMLQIAHAPAYQNDCFLKDSIIGSFIESNRMGNNSVPLEYLDFIPVSGQPNSRMYKYFEDILYHSMNQEIGATYLVKGILMKILFDLIDRSLYETTPVRLGNEKDAGIFEAITDIMVETNGRISRTKLSEKMNYNGNYLNKIAKKYTGMNLFQYGTSICMKEACRLLRETELSVSQIAEQLGFSNRTHFYKLFEKKYGIPPAKYRKYKELSDSAHSDSQIFQESSL